MRRAEPDALIEELEGLGEPSTAAAEPKPATAHRDTVADDELPEPGVEASTEPDTATRESPRHGVVREPRRRPSLGIPSSHGLSVGGARPESIGIETGAFLLKLSVAGARASDWSESNWGSCGFGLCRFARLMPAFGEARSSK